VLLSKEMMEIPNHQRQSDELNAGEIIDDKYVIAFFFEVDGYCTLR